LQKIVKPKFIIYRDLYSQKKVGLAVTVNKKQKTPTPTHIQSTQDALHVAIDVEKPIVFIICFISERYLVQLPR